MQILHLKLENFRNYNTLDLDFAPGINMIYGLNGQGKTNIAEAIYFFAVAKSHRVLKDKDLIMHGKNYAKMELDFLNKERDFNAKINLFSEKNREIFVNDIKAVKNSDLIGRFNAVLFSPEDFSLIKDGPGERRRFTDIAISQVKPNYFLRLTEYNKVLKMKNKVLKEGLSYAGMIDIYNEKLAEIGADIIFYRNKFYEFLKPISQDFHREISLSLDKFDIVYEPCVKVDDRRKMKDEIYKKLSDLKMKELDERFCSFGIHREDVSFYINEKKVKEFASQGQQRTVILILKLAQAEYMKEITGEYPVLLLDDILSELDATRRKYFLSEIKNKQVIITATDKGSFGRRKDTKLIHVQNGHVSEWKINN